MPNFKKADPNKKDVSMMVPAEFRQILENIKKNFGCDMKQTMKVIADRIMELDVDWKEQGKVCKVVSQETRAKMAKARESIQEQRKAIMEMYDDGLTVNEIHEETGAKITTIESWTGIAQKRIMDYMEDKYALPTYTQLMTDCDVTKATAKGAIAVMTGDTPTRWYKNPHATKIIKRFK